MGRTNKKKKGQTVASTFAVGVSKFTRAVFSGQGEMKGVCLSRASLSANPKGLVAQKKITPPLPWELVTHFESYVITFLFALNYANHASERLHLASEGPKSLNRRLTRVHLVSNSDSRFCSIPQRYYRPRTSFSRRLCFAIRFGPL